MMITWLQEQYRADVSQQENEDDFQFRFNMMDDIVGIDKLQ